MFRKVKHPVCLLFAVVLLLQFAVLLVCAVQKEAYSVDEFYSYILSNSYDTDRISNDEGVFGTWLEGEYFDKFVQVDAGEGFSYGAVNRNNSLDAHPPLYYFLLHTFSSFFPAVFSKWIGLSLNLLAFLGTQTLLFFLARRVTKNASWALLAIALCGATAAFLDMHLFIRMYPLQTFLAVLFVYLNVRLYESRREKWVFGAIFLTSFLGAYTQYYFVLLAFFVAAAMCFFLLKKKEYKALSVYALGMLLSVLLLFLLYPAAIVQITGSETNNVGKEVMGGLLDFGGIVGATLRFCHLILRGALLAFWEAKLVTLPLLAAGVLLSVLYREKQPVPDAEKQEKDAFGVGFALVLVSVLVGTVVLVAHLSGKFAYLRYVYFLFPLFSLFAALCLRLVFVRFRLFKTGFVACFLAAALCASAAFCVCDLSDYRYSERAENEAALARLSEQYPVVFVTNGKTYHMTANYNVLSSAKNVYLYRVGEDSLRGALASAPASEKLLFIVLTDREWSEGFEGVEMMQTLLGEAQELSACERIGSCEFSEVYLVSR